MINVALHKPIIDALLFSLAIAVGITPQLLPAVVSASLAAGSRQMARRKVLVKRLVCIEDLGDVDVLFTDKTGTLTEGRISFMRGLGADGASAGDTVRWGLLCTEAALTQGRCRRRQSAGCRRSGSRLPPPSSGSGWPAYTRLAVLPVRPRAAHGVRPRDR